MENIDGFAFITQDSSEVVVPFLVSYIDKMFSSIEFSISRCKGFMAFGSDEKKIAEAEKSICRLLAHISNSLLELSQSALPLDLLLDNVTNILIKAHAIFDVFAKHLLNRVKVTKSRDVVDNAKFIQLVIMVTSDLKGKVEKLKLAIEKQHSDLDRNYEEEGKKKGRSAAQSKSRLLKEGKNIPKLYEKQEAFEQTVISLGKL